MRTKSLTEALDKYQDQENIHGTEGRRGVVTLAKVARAIGYRDSSFFGSLGQNAFAGDLIEFFEDNSGAVVAVLEWIRERNVAEWHEHVESQLDDEEEEDEEDEEEESIGHNSDEYDALLDTDDHCDPLGPPDERDE